MWSRMRQRGASAGGYAVAGGSVAVCRGRVPGSLICLSISRSSSSRSARPQCLRQGRSGEGTARPSWPALPRMASCVRCIRRAIAAGGSRAAMSARNCASSSSDHCRPPFARARGGVGRSSPPSPVIGAASCRYGLVVWRAMASCPQAECEAHRRPHTCGRGSLGSGGPETGSRPSPETRRDGAAWCRADAAPARSVLPAQRNGGSPWPTRMRHCVQDG